MIITRVWAMPSRWTFKCKPIKEIVDRYVGDGMWWIDPFAGKNSPAQYTNDMNPEMPTTNHVDATVFVKQMAGMKTLFNGCILDPPYSMEQVSRSYNDVGIHDWQTRYGNNKAGNFAPLKDIVAEMIDQHGIVISCGWNTSGMGKNRNFEIVEILVVCHGGNRHDTLVTVERQLATKVCNYREKW